MNCDIPNIKKYRKYTDYVRYSRPIPGDRVQIDVIKVGPKCYQFTAVDDCTRMRALELYSNKKAESAVDFLGYILDTFQFPFSEYKLIGAQSFSTICFSMKLTEHFIKFKPIKPRSPHFNGKVERSQLSDKSEFYATISRKERNLDLAPKLLDWQHFITIEDLMFL